MRLKAKFRDATAFMRIIHAMSRMSSRCILRFSPEEIQIVIPKGLDSVETWACLDELPAFFSEYRVESNFNNQVNLEVSTESMLHALRSASTAGADCIIKLAKKDKDHPVLSLEIATTSDLDQVVHVTHHIPVKVKKTAEMAGLKTAEDSTAGMQANVASRFPSIIEVRSVAERMKTLNPDKIHIAANRMGQVKLVMSNDSINLETVWNHLKPGDDEEMDDAQAEASKRFRSVQVDLKAFLKLVSCQLPEHDTELWIYSGACATFVFHIKSNVGSKAISAHIMVHLPSLGDV